jgi:predicted RNase H-like HicB family nuclease
MKYLVIHEKTDIGYSCYVPDLPASVAAGYDLPEKKALMERAIELKLSGMRVDGDLIPVLTTTN